MKAGKWNKAAAAWSEYFSARKVPLNMVAPTGEEPDPTWIRNAERVVAHEIRGWHDLTYKFGKTVDFNANWGRSGIYGTHYWGWSECLRVAFGQTGDTRYVECFDDLFNQWYEQRNSIDNPAIHDVIFYELGLGGRTPRFIDHYFAYRSTGILRPVTHRRMLKSILGAGRWLYFLEKDEGYRSGKLADVRLVGAGLRGGTLPGIQGSRKLGQDGRQTTSGARRQGLLRGRLHHERASGYGAWCTRISEDLLCFSDRIPYIKMETDLRARIVRMYDWFLSTTSPLGESQGFNDGGIGRRGHIAAGHRTHRRRPISLARARQDRIRFPDPAEETRLYVYRQATFGLCRHAFGLAEGCQISDCQLRALGRRPYP